MRKNLSTKGQHIMEYLRRNHCSKGMNLEKGMVLRQLYFNGIF